MTWQFAKLRTIPRDNATHDLNSLHACILSLVSSHQPVQMVKYPYQAHGHRGREEDSTCRQMSKDVLRERHLLYTIIVSVGSVNNRTNPFVSIYVLMSLFAGAPSVPALCSARHSTRRAPRLCLWAARGSGIAANQRCTCNHQQSARSFRVLLPPGLLLLQPLPALAEGARSNGLSRYIKKRRLEPLENYVPAVVAARQQLAACESQLGTGTGLHVLTQTRFVASHQRPARFAIMPLPAMLGSFCLRLQRSILPGVAVCRCSSRNSTPLPRFH